MRTMYRVETRVYTDCECRYSEWTQVQGYVDTEAEAQAIADTVKRTDAWHTGDWCIIARTMDEQTFTVVDNTVASFDYYKEVQRYIYAEEQVERYTKHIEEVEASKVRCKTERGIERKDKEIAQYREWLAQAQAVLAEKNK